MVWVGCLEEVPLQAPQEGSGAAPEQRGGFPAQVVPEKSRRFDARASAKVTQRGHSLDRIPAEEVAAAAPDDAAPEEKSGARGAHEGRGEGGGGRGPLRHRIS